jgi:uncharacterized membrane protein (DUF373 family)
MDVKKIGVQAVVAAVIFIVFSVIIAGDYSQEMLIHKASRGLIFGLVYFVFLILKEKYKNNKEEK